MCQIVKDWKKENENEKEKRKKKMKTTNVINVMNKTLICINQMIVTVIIIKIFKNNVINYVSINNGYQN